MEATNLNRRIATYTLEVEFETDGREEQFAEETALRLAATPNFITVEDGVRLMRVTAHANGTELTADRNNQTLH